jgi:hypothetical protein
MPGRKLFTLEQAAAMLPALRAELLEMQALKRQIDELRGELTSAVATASGNGHVARERAAAETRQRAEDLVAALNERVARITDRGCELKGLDEGLIDFPSEREGRVVYLCWKPGEERIEFWHELTTGFDGRQAL